MVDFSPGNNYRSTLIINIVAILFFEQPREHTVLTLQFLVGPLLNNTSIFEHNDFIHIAQRTQAVRNHQDGAPHHKGIDGSQHLDLCFDVQASGRLVQHQDGRINHNLARDR